MKITWYGTASVAIETRQTKVIFDPFLPMEGSEVPSFKYEFQSYKHILLTHGHFDHMGSLKEIYGPDPRVHIYLTQIPYDTLCRLGMKNLMTRKICQGDRFMIGDLRITAYKAKHIKYDVKLLAKTFLSTKMIQDRDKMPEIMKLFTQYPEGGETTAYLVEGEGKTVMILGSMALDPQVRYPKHMDALVLPFQGRSDLKRVAKSIVHELQPKHVYIDHYDDTFPPLSRSIDVSCFAHTKKATVLNYGQAYELQ